MLAPLDEDMAAALHNLLRKHGVKLKLGSSVEGFRQDDDQVSTLLKDESLWFLIWCSWLSV